MGGGEKGPSVANQGGGVLAVQHARRKRKTALNVYDQGEKRGICLSREKWRKNQASNLRKKKKREI